MTPGSAGPLRPAEPLDVPVPGGRLRVGRWGCDGPVVLAVHGVTATHVSWIEVARRLPGARVVAPDLRGRGRSAGVAGPYGLDRHADDLAAVLDAVGCERAVVAGHSMGGFVAVALAVRRPDLVSRLVLVDGGLALSGPEEPATDGIEVTIGPAAARLAMTFPDRQAYRDFWRQHPAMAPMWGPAVEAYVDYDLEGTPPELRSSCRPEALRVDGSAVMDHPARAAAWAQVQAPTTFLRAERGLLDEPRALYGRVAPQRWQGGRAALDVRTVPDTNHYSLLLGARGAAAVADAVREALAAVDALPS